MKKKLIACFLVLSMFLAACLGGCGNYRAVKAAAHAEKYYAYVELLNFSTGMWFDNQIIS